jgi:hypothetical protein
LADRFVVVRLDTKNGKAGFVEKLDVKRNATFVLILKSDGSELSRLANPKTLESITEILDGDEGSDQTVKIAYPGVDIPTRDTKASISDLALGLLRSSELNSARHVDHFPGGTRRVHANYRKAFKGRHLVIAFDVPKSIKTSGGKVTASEIVVDLNHADRKDPLFTIDLEGRVIEHAKTGTKNWDKLFDAIKKAIEDG